MPEHDLLQKERSIKRNANHRQCHSLPPVHLERRSDSDSAASNVGHVGHKGKGREAVDRSILGEWVVNVDEMDAGLGIYGSRERVILVIGGQ